MGYPHIALIGRARAGKDTIAARLVGRHAYTRVALADPLKELVLRADPIVTYEPTGYGPLPVRLGAIIKRHGWEEAKNRFPEVRRTLQRVGHAVRDQEPGYWLSIALDKIAVADMWSLPVVVTDCRYENEARALRAAGFRMVRVTRPGVRDRGPGHVSETELDGYPVDVTIANMGTVADLNSLADQLI
ncbi:hypothetical protein [Streptomyces alkaliterrae]|uniref:Adenylate kinase n=1 Tax=Streptomyces alkaliterrae TaxID=2213162 RepID=A0A5P0YLL3_9ACTN|nr:hypothetical protein [Streptomyces alkaliterrae]MBB1251851.1 hypothetical protein [Streptomyces alkaliterrae]MBB1259310.1 hypothetical protein [Streptomyces alkaliterrae]MQS00312.1 hypothetical protein [Streptomyces alkaliterrae]